jgi:hypothetical protein
MEMEMNQFYYHKKAGGVRFRNGEVYRAFLQALQKRRNETISKR